jgi:hypothetical protein
MAKKGRPSTLTTELLALIKTKGQQGKTSPEISQEIFKETGISIPHRTIRTYLEEFNFKEEIKKAASELLHEGALKTTLQHEIEQTVARKQFLLTEAAKIWEAIPKTEKNSIKVFLKLIELAQKDSEMLFKVLGLPEPTVQDTQTLTKSLEEKLKLV